jgi:hypothetical protein
MGGGCPCLGREGGLTAAAPAVVLTSVPGIGGTNARTRVCDPLIRPDAPMTSPT